MSKLLDFCFHLRSRFVIRGTHGIFLDCPFIKFFAFNSGSFFCPGLNSNPKMIQNHLSNSTSCNPGSSFTARSPAAASVISKSIFLVKRKIGMAWPECIHKISIIRRMLGSIAYYNCNRRSFSFSFKNSRKDFRMIRFISCCNRSTFLAIYGSSRATFIQRSLNLVHINGKPGWTTVNHYAQTNSMTFSKRCYPKN